MHLNLFAPILPSPRSQRGLTCWAEPLRRPADPWVELLVDGASLSLPAWNEALDELEARVRSLPTPPLALVTRRIGEHLVPVLTTRPRDGARVSLHVSTADLDPSALGLDILRNPPRALTPLLEAEPASPEGCWVDGQAASTVDQITALGCVLWLESRFPSGVLVRGRFTSAAVEEARAWVAETFGGPVPRPVLMDAARLWARVGHLPGAKRLIAFDRVVLGRKHEALRIVLPLASNEAVDEWLEHRLCGPGFPCGPAQVGAAMAWVACGWELSRVHSAIVARGSDVQAADELARAWVAALARAGLFLAPPIRKSIRSARERLASLDRSIDPNLIDKLEAGLANFDHGVYVTLKQLEPLANLDHRFTFDELADRTTALGELVRRETESELSRVAELEATLHDLEAVDDDGGLSKLTSVDRSLHPTLRVRLREASAVLRVPVPAGKRETRLAELAELTHRLNLPLLETAWSWLETNATAEDLRRVAALVASASPAPLRTALSTRESLARYSSGAHSPDRPWQLRVDHFAGELPDRLSQRSSARVPESL